MRRSREFTGARAHRCRVGSARAAGDRRRARGEVVPYDAERPELTPAGARFRWRGRDVQLAVPGLHNAVNAAGALSACAAAGADPAQAVAAIADFQGARRRMELLGADVRGRTWYTTTTPTTR